MAMSNKRSASPISVDDEKRCKSSRKSSESEVANPNPNPLWRVVSVVEAVRFPFPSRAYKQFLTPGTWLEFPFVDPKPCKFTRDELDPKPFYDALIKCYRQPVYKTSAFNRHSDFDLGYFVPFPCCSYFGGLDVKASDSPEEDVISATVAEAGVDMGLEEYNNLKGTDLSRKEIVRLNEAPSRNGYAYFITFKASDDKSYESCVYYSCCPLTLHLMTPVRPSRFTAKENAVESKYDVEQNQHLKGPLEELVSFVVKTDA